MSSYRIMRSYRVFGLVVAIGSLFCPPSYAQERYTLPIQDPCAVMQSVLSAVKTMEHPRTGRGKAVIKVENYHPFYDGKELNVDFAFKDKKFRTEIFESDVAGVLSRLDARVKSDKASIHVSKMDAYIDRVELYDNRFGRNFHPDQFFDVLGYPLIEWLEFELKNRRSDIDRSVEIDSDGIIHLWVRRHIETKRIGKYDVEFQIWFDSQKGLRPVFYDRKFKYPNGSWDGINVKLQWDKFDSAWYVSAFEYNELPSNHAHVIGTVKSFHPNVGVSDEEFTLAALDLPDRFLVRDKIAGMTYSYGNPDSHIDDLEKPLQEANFVQKIQRQQPTDQNQLTIVDTNSLTTAIGQTSAHSNWPRGIAIVFVIALIGIFVFPGYRKIIQKKSEWNAK